MRKDCSLVATFKGVCDTLSISRPMLFLLENVDALETSDDVHKLRAHEYGLPQRRVRLYFFGVREECPDLAEPAETVLARERSPGHAAPARFAASGRLDFEFKNAINAS